MIMITDDLRINADALQFIIETRTITKEGKNAGKEIWTAQTFHSNLSSVLNMLLKKKLYLIPKRKDMNLEEFLNTVHDEISKFDKLITKCASKNAKVLETTLDTELKPTKK